MNRTLSVLLMWLSCGLAFGAAAVSQAVPAVPETVQSEHVAALPSVNTTVLSQDAAATSKITSARVAGEPQPAVSLSQGFDFSALGQLLAGLVLVLVVFLGLAWLVKRTGVAGGFSQHGLKVVASLPLSSRERVVLIEAGSKQLLLGVAQGRVNLLESFDQPLVEPPAAPQASFSHWLQKSMNRSDSAKPPATDSHGSSHE
ncbi:MAG: flagellar biosynthetic protein FliO [Motiliproteus sp.]